MEFLGSFWRCKLKSDEFSQALVTADFSVNAVRRLSLEPNQNLWIELPSERIWLLIIKRPDYEFYKYRKCINQA